MVGKLNLDLGDDYAYDIRRAREVAEIMPMPVPAPPAPVPEVFGPFTTQGTEYWIRTVEWAVAVDTDDVPGPDLFLDPQVLDSDLVTPTQRAAVKAKLRQYGWPG